MSVAREKNIPRIKDHLCIDLFISFLFLMFFFLAVCLASKNWYVSQEQGNQTIDCNSPKRFCKSLADVLTVVDWDDKIYLDGTNTEKNPYACASMKSQLQGISLNVSLSLIGQNGPAYLSCPSGIFFIGRFLKV